MATVAVDAANVRSSPSLVASVIDQVKSGTELHIIQQSADWVNIQLPDSREGWLAAGWIVTAAQSQQEHAPDPCPGSHGPVPPNPIAGLDLAAVKAAQDEATPKNCSMIQLRPVIKILC
ncbi:MAG: SH3 domain-containing protein [Chloroflexi bacterium]|nr:SH3 domain-containing protein [Chloroflexota bacterium]